MIINDVGPIYDAGKRAGTYEYVGQVGEGWWRWPAERDGWAERRAHHEPTDRELADLIELDALGVRVAILASGVAG